MANEQLQNQTDESPIWEVGIKAWGPGDDPNEDRWEHYHPRADTKEEAKEKAVEEAKSGVSSLIGRRDGFDVFMVEGPFDE